MSFSIGRALVSDLNTGQLFSSSLLIITRQEIWLQPSKARKRQSGDNLDHPESDAIKSSIKKATANRCGLMKNAVPYLRQALPSVTQVVSSNQATQRHTEFPTYRCFLPDLTGFIGLCCAGPGCQHHLPEASLTNACLKIGIRPCYSGLQVEGTATSPPSTANQNALLRARSNDYTCSSWLVKIIIPDATDMCQDVMLQLQRHML
jgi:hypothetical protein